MLIPKSASPEHIRSNFDVWDFKLEPTEIAEVNELTKLNFKTDWDPKDEA